MRLGICAPNIRAGGGVVHLCELLRHADPESHGVKEVVVWGSRGLLEEISSRPWLRKEYHALLDGSVAARRKWCSLKGTISSLNACGVVLSPDAFPIKPDVPVVSFAQNLLPFDAREKRRFGFTPTRLRLELLRHTQSSMFRKSAGVIFHSDHSRSVIQGAVGKLTGKTVVVPHGVAKEAFCHPRQQMPLSYFDSNKPFQWVYISTVNLYKHQWIAVDAAALLRRKGIPLRLVLVGSAYPPAERRLREAMSRCDPDNDFVVWRGNLAYDKVSAAYACADAALSCSTCETFGMTVLEAMAAGLPNACSRSSATPEVLGASGIYFEPEDADSTANAMWALMKDPELREDSANKGHERAKLFSWENVAAKTLEFAVSFAL